jgi:hypothetical protein
MQKDFKLETLKKTMAVAPSLYDHNWDAKGELILSVSQNIGQ